MSTADAGELRSRVQRFLAEHPPERGDRLEFLRVLRRGPGPGALPRPSFPR